MNLSSKTSIKYTIVILNLKYLHLMLNQLQNITQLNFATAIAKAKSKMFNGKNKHLSLRHNIVLQLLETGVISLNFVRLDLNLIDPLTIPLNRKLVE